jgi:hypothetical protein
MAQGRDGDWEAICLDLDIAVQGESFDEVAGSLHAAIATYYSDARAEEPDARRRLLNRKAPLAVRFGYLARFFWAALTARDDATRHGFTVPCAA